MTRKPKIYEKKESRISLLVVPSLYRKIALLSDSQGLSMNEFVTALLEKTVQKNATLLEAFESAREAAKKSYVDVD